MTPDELELLEAVFLPEARGYLDRLEAGPSSGEAAAILHNFRGAAGTVGLTELASRVAALETRVHAGTLPAPEELAALRALLAGALAQSQSAAPAPAPTPAPAQDSPSFDDVRMQQELRGTFVVEAREHLEAMSQAMMRLEADRADRAPLAELLRKTHTIKGAAGTVGFAEVGTLAHRLEDVLSAVSKGKLDLDAQVFDRLLAAVDLLSAMLHRVEAGEAPIAPAPADDPLRGLLDGVERARLGPPHLQPAPRAPARAPAQLPGRFAAAMGMNVPAPAAPAAPAAPTLGERMGARPAIAAAAAVGSDSIGTLDDERSATGGDLLSGTGEIADDAQSDAQERRRRTGADRRYEKEVVRVDLGRVDVLQGTLGDLVIGRNRDDLRVADLKALSGDLVSGRRRLVAQIETIRALTTGAADAPGKVDAADILQRLADHERRLVEFDTRLNGSLAQMERLIAAMNEDGEQRRRALLEMEHQITSIRMMSVKFLYARLQRPVRDAGRQMGREVTLVTEGDDVELDKSVVDQISDPLIHLVRNAVAHGIEPPDVRARRGKPRNGTVRVSARRLGGSILIDVSDDGGGMDPGRIRAALVRAGLATSARAAQLRDGELTEAIFMAGVSTRHTVDDVAGRGVGLDLVRANVEAVGGTIELRTRMGEGTTFTIRLPQTLMILPALMVEAGGHQFAVPMMAVRAVTRVAPEDVRAGARGEGERLDFRKERIPLVRLERLLGLPAARAAVRPTVVLEGDAGPYALMVDALAGREEIVAKSLGPLLAGLRAFAGATLTGTGRICLILDAATLHRQRGASVAVHGEERRTPLVLLVDDSTSIREAVKRIMTTAGYRVQTAADGLEAWDLLRSGDVDLVVTDLEMPGMSGYDLLDRVRRSPRHRGLPVIVLTGLSSDDNRRIAREKGARDYLVKPVNRKIVLEKVAAVLGGIPAPG